MKRKNTGKNELWEWVKTLIIAFIIVGCVRFFLVAPIIVDGESMMPTLKNGDRMIVNKIGYSIGELDRYDIVVFHATEEKDYIKRIIGLPGDHVAYEDDQLYINGEVVDEPFLASEKQEVSEHINLTEDFTLEEITGVDVIPEGKVFVLGDNRRNSSDSRAIGLVEMDEIMGTTKYVFWPFKEMGAVE